MAIDFPGIDPVRQEDRSLDGGPVREALAADRNALKVQNAYAIIVQALEFIEAETKAHSFYAGRPLADSIQERINKIGPDLAPSSPNDSAPSYLSDAAFFDGQQTEIGKLEELRFKVKQAILVLRSSVTDKLDRSLVRE